MHLYATSAQRSVALVGSLLFLVAAATACTSAEVDRNDLGDADLRLVTTSQDDGRAGGSNLSGTVGMNDDGCIGVMDGDNFTVVSWFEGSQLVDGPGIRLPDGMEVLLGDAFEGAGTLTESGEDESQVCPSAGEVLMLSAVTVPE